MGREYQRVRDPSFATEARSWVNPSSHFKKSALRSLNEANQHLYIFTAAGLGFQFFSACEVFNFEASKIL